MLSKLDVGRSHPVTLNEFTARPEASRAERNKLTPVPRTKYQAWRIDGLRSDMVMTRPHSSSGGVHMRHSALRPSGTR